MISKSCCIHMLVSGKAMLTKYFKNSLCTFSDLKTTQILTVASKVMSRGYLTVFHLFLTSEILTIIFSLSVQPKQNLKMQWLASSVTFIQHLFTGYATVSLGTSSRFILIILA